ncbi:hypothetical protein ASU31_19160 [Pedobacter ginsenosidimutans]|uniref:Uncharacterized protein n=1 Tax=Pedobacter ginsenosidimutans TaxID=687842 RepID=A0A0T5VLA9_9SPHI|nr:hypothetical protein ASU31_19160 [Pedobacter ginsenosidimutans]
MCFLARPSFLIFEFNVVAGTPNNFAAPSDRKSARYTTLISEYKAEAVQVEHTKSIKRPEHPDLKRQKSKTDSIKKGKAIQLFPLICHQLTYIIMIYH